MWKRRKKGERGKRKKGKEEKGICVDSIARRWLFPRARDYDLNLMIFKESRCQAVAKEKPSKKEKGKKEKRGGFAGRSCGSGQPIAATVVPSGVGESGMACCRTSSPTHRRRSSRERGGKGIGRCARLKYFASSVAHTHSITPITPHPWHQATTAEAGRENSFRKKKRKKKGTPRRGDRASLRPVQRPIHRNTTSRSNSRTSSCHVRRGEEPSL